ncbi:DUF1990 family protein [Myxococcus sp. K15C18031901]|uniref:DUF1990 family protein n=1 Tax=Myxococcus dinghuensis TaxID=2906761 RepID=UPI0020A77B7C|nr:DUF1990 family protein [Myxococcus dinghuensis]MCP3099170.1 DUF1990 family protein [Myxococcus dinghuensis]
MIRWRIGKGWSEESLSLLLREAEGLPRNFTAASGEMTLERGWNQVHSEASLGHEPPGPPCADGLFARARRVLETFDFSDPRIVRWHFLADAPLAGRTVLLELKSVRQWVRHLVGARVGDVREEQGEEFSVFGFSFETLEGHIEEGREWFLLQKRHADGEVRFRIEAAWRPGRFPTAWSRLGFAVVGRYYQRAWHEQTQVRLRELTWHHPELVGSSVHHGKVDHSTDRLRPSHVHFFSRRAPGRLTTLMEEEVETVEREDWLAPVGLGVLAGMRSLSAPALMSQRLSESPREAEDPLSRALTRPWVPQVLRVLAVGELVADKLPRTPARVKFVPLTGRILMGTVAAASSVGEQPRHRVALAAALGATAAVASSWAFYSLRRLATTRLRIPSVAAALAEDALVAALATRVLTRLRANAA